MKIFLRLTLCSMIAVASLAAQENYAPVEIEGVKYAFDLNHDFHNRYYEELNTLHRDFASSILISEDLSDGAKKIIESSNLTSENLSDAAKKIIEFSNLFFVGSLQNIFFSKLSDVVNQVNLRDVKKISQISDTFESALSMLPYVERPRALLLFVFSDPAKTNEQYLNSVKTYCLDDKNILDILKS